MNPGVPVTLTIDRVVQNINHYQKLMVTRAGRPALARGAQLE